MGYSNWPKVAVSVLVRALLPNRIRGGGEGQHPSHFLQAEVAHQFGPMTSGILRGIEDGWFMSEIADAAFTYQIALEKGEKKVVGVNCHTESVSKELEILRVSHEVELDQVSTLTARRAARDEAAVVAAVRHLIEVAATSENMVPAMLDAVRAEATLGEICNALRDIWGVYREPARF